MCCHPIGSNDETNQSFHWMVSYLYLNVCRLSFTDETSNKRGFMCPYPACYSLRTTTNCFHLETVLLALQFPMLSLLFLQLHRQADIQNWSLLDTCLVRKAHNITYIFSVKC